jgi:streptogramin lyase
MNERVSWLIVLMFLLGVASCGGGGGGGTEIEKGNTRADISGVELRADGYVLEQVMVSELGLPFQTALLPDGTLVVADPNNNRIVTISNGAVDLLAEPSTGAVATLPDGQVCYAKPNGEVRLSDPASGTESSIGSTGTWTDALAVDQSGNIYAAAGRVVYRFDPSGNRSTAATGLPLDFITDIDIATDGTVYVAGASRVISIDINGKVTVIADGLNYEPVWVEVAPNGIVYINDVSQGLQRYDPGSGELVPFNVDGFSPFNDIHFPTVDEIVFYETNGIFFKFNLTTKLAIPLFVDVGNSTAFAASADDAVFFATPSKQTVLNSHIIRLESSGTRRDLNSLTYGAIGAADVDKMNRLCLATNEGFQRLEADNTITSITPNFSEEPPEHLQTFAVGPDGFWYVIASNLDDSIQVYQFDDLGNVTLIPIAFSPSSFGDATLVSGASIDVGDDGQIVLIVTANVVWGHAPFYQRVFRANADGTDLTEVARLDSQRLGGPVDIAAGPNGEIFVLSVQGTVGHEEIVYRIDQNNAVHEFMAVRAGDDPFSIDVDASGNVWVSTMRGIFRASPVN